MVHPPPPTPPVVQPPCQDSRRRPVLPPLATSSAAPQLDAAFHRPCSGFEIDAVPPPKKPTGCDGQVASAPGALVAHRGRGGSRARRGGATAIRASMSPLLPSAASGHFPGPLRVRVDAVDLRPRPRAARKGDVGRRGGGGQGGRRGKQRVAVGRQRHIRSDQGGAGFQQVRGELQPAGGRAEGEESIAR